MSNERSIYESEFWDRIIYDVYGPRKGGAVIFCDAQDARRGIAKTSAKVAIGKLFARAFNYNIKKEDFTLSGKHYLKRAQQGLHFDESQPTVLGVDEFVGSGTGDKRKSMTNENILLSSAWQMLRTKRVVTIATLPDWNEADKRMRKYADYRMWCQERPMGYFKPYKVKVHFNGGGQNPVYLSGLGHGKNTERITFPDMDKQNDPHYQHLTEQKNTVLESDDFDADAVLSEAGDSEESALSEQEVRREFLQEICIRMAKPWTEQYGMSYGAIETAIDEERKDSWIGDRVREWKNGKHRDIVRVPDDEPTDAINQAQA